MARQEQLESTHWSPINHCPLLTIIQEAGIQSQTAVVCRSQSQTAVVSRSQSQTTVISSSHSQTTVVSSSQQ